MTVENEIYREDYDGNDSTTSFPVDFYFLEDEHLGVTLRDDQGVETTQVLDTDYTVIGAGVQSGGSVEMVVPPATGEHLTILRDVPLTQLYDYLENDNFPAESHETALDKLTMIGQQMSEEDTRNIRVSDTYDIDGETVPEADSFMVWNSTGDQVVTLSYDDFGAAGFIDRLTYNQSVDTLIAVAAGIELYSGQVIDEFSIDGTLAGNSDTALPTEKAVKTYFDTEVLNLEIESLQFTVNPWTILNSIGEIAVRGYNNSHVELRHDDLVALSTITGGVNVRSHAPGASAYVTFSDSDNAAQGVIHAAGSGSVFIRPGSWDGGIVINEGAAVELYYSGILSMKTSGSGIEVFDNSGNDPTIYFYNDAAVAQGFMRFTNGGGFTIYNSVGADTYMVAVANGAVELYYDGLRAVSTAAAGLNLYDTDGDDPVLGFHDNGGIRQGYVRFINGATLEVFDDLNDDLYLKGNPNAAVELYYNGLKAFETTAFGIEVFDTAGTIAYLTFKSDADVTLGRISADGNVYMNPASGDAGIIVYDNAGVVLHYNGIVEGQTQNGFFLATNAFSVASTVTVDAILDEDNLVSDSATALVTQQSVKKYIDDAVVSGGGALNFLGDTGSGTIILGTESLTIAGGDGVATVAVSNSLQIDVVSPIVTPLGADAIVWAEGGAVELYYDGVKAAETAQWGLTVQDVNHTEVTVKMLDAVGVEVGKIYHSSTYGYAVRGQVQGGLVSVVGVKTGGGGSRILEGDPDGAASLYFNGTKAFETYNDGSNGSGLLVHSYDQVNGLYFTVNNAGKTEFADKVSFEVYMNFIKDGAVELYYDGLVAFQTRNDGIRISDTSGAQPSFTMTDDADVSQASFGVDGGDFYVWGSIASDYLFKADSGGATFLYYNGIVTLTTYAGGIEINDNVGEEPSIYLNNDAGVAVGRVYRTVANGLALRSYVHGGVVRLQGEDTGGTNQTLLSGNPDGGVELYEDGSIAAYTTPSGLSLQDTNGATPSLGFVSDVDADLCYIQGSASQLRIYDWGTAAYIFTINFGSDTKLFYDGNEAFATHAEGVVVRDPAGDTPKIYFYEDGGVNNGYVGWVGNHIYISNDVHGGDIHLNAQDDGGVLRALRFDSNSQEFYPLHEYDLGSSANRWDTVFSVNSLNTSDGRLKNVLSESLGLDFIMNLAPVTFEWIEKPGKPHQGLVAQDVKITADRLGVDFGGYDDPADRGREGSLSLNYNEFIAPLVRAIQELKRELDELKNDLD